MFGVSIYCSAKLSISIASVPCPDGDEQLIIDSHYYRSRVSFTGGNRPRPAEISGGNRNASTQGGIQSIWNSSN